MADTKSLTHKIIKFRDARDWKQFHNPKDVALSLVLEAAELMEHFQWKSPEEVSSYVKTHKADIADELADVLYWALLLSHDLNIDLPRALNLKLRKNSKKYPIKKSKGRHTKYNRF